MQVEERLGQGADTLQQLLDTGQADSFDFAFIGQHRCLVAICAAWSGCAAACNISAAGLPEAHPSHGVQQ